MGFLSLNKKIRKQELEEIKEKSQTVILYEAPHKINNTLEDLEQIIPERNLVIAKELTKIHETFYRGTPQELQEKLENPKGEFIILIEGKKQEEKLNDFLTKLSLKEHYQYYEQQGLKKKDIIKKIAKDRNVSKNEIYQKFI